MLQWLLWKSMRSCALLWSLLMLSDGALGNFVSSLHSNFVVNLDFEGSAVAGGDNAQANESKVMAFAGGRQQFRCNLPSRSSRHKPTTGGDLDDFSKFKSHFKSAKLAPLKGKCWTTKKDYWSYDVCFGRKILQYRPDSDARFSLGEHVAEADTLQPDGHVTESFVGGTDNRSSEIHYVCGPGGEGRTFQIEEPNPLKYSITVSGPMFCMWREKDGTETRDADGKVLPISALLEDLRSNCVNVTQGWWTYEYCYPHSLRQFHLGNGGQRDPEHVLGTLSGTSEPIGVGEVNISMVRLKPSLSPRERRAPPSNHFTLRQFLGGGTVCDETNRPRTTTMHFQCPPNWLSQGETRIVNINEGSLCEYDILVHTNLLCGHQKLIPALPRGKEVIQCVAKAKEL